MIGDLETRVNPPEQPEQNDPSIERILDLADEAQSIWPGSFVEIVVHIPDSPYRGGEITDNYRLYSVRLETKP